MTDSTPHSIRVRTAIAEASALGLTIVRRPSERPYHSNTIPVFAVYRGTDYLLTLRRITALEQFTVAYRLGYQHAQARDVQKETA